jgi:hypothetical protein
MKLDAILCAVIVALTLVIPCAAWVLGYSEALANHSEERATSSKRWETIARDTEQGKIQTDPANFPQYLRMQGRQDLELARMYGSLAQALKGMTQGLVGIAMVQAALLVWLVNRRRKRLRGVSET